MQHFRQMIIAWVSIISACIADGAIRINVGNHRHMCPIVIIVAEGNDIPQLRLIVCVGVDFGAVLTGRFLNGICTAMKPCDIRTALLPNPFDEVGTPVSAAALAESFFSETVDLTTFLPYVGLRQVGNALPEGALRARFRGDGPGGLIPINCHILGFLGHAAGHCIFVGERKPCPRNVVDDVISDGTMQKMRARRSCPDNGEAVLGVLGPSVPPTILIVNGRADPAHIVRNVGANRPIQTVGRGNFALQRVAKAVPGIGPGNAIDGALVVTIIPGEILHGFAGADPVTGKAPVGAPFVALPFGNRLLDGASGERPPGTVHDT